MNEKREIQVASTASLAEARAWLLEELDALGQVAGRAVEQHTACALATAVQWLRLAGHGWMKLPALNHRLADKFRVNTVMPVRKPPRPSERSGRSIK